MLFLFNFENIPTIFSSDIFSKSPDDYHKAANKKISCSRMVSCSAATLIALLIWGLFNIHPQLFLSLVYWQLLAYLSLVIILHYLG